MAAPQFRCYPRPMAPRARRRATYADLLAVPDDLVAELIDGELYTTPRPGPRHAKASTALAAALHGPFDAGRGGPAGWTILFEPELHLADEVAVPDLAGWRRDRMPLLPDTPYFTLAPDWICEVQSPSTAALDRAKKLRVYAREDVRHAWMVDPAARTLEVLRLQQGQWLIVSIHASADVLCAEPFSAIDLDLSDLWELREEV